MTLEFGNFDPRTSDRVRKKDFVKVLAEYLVGDQVRRSIQLEMADPDAKLWARMRGLTPLLGYPDVEEAERQLAEWLL